LYVRHFQNFQKRAEILENFSKYFGNFFSEIVEIVKSGNLRKYFPNGAVILRGNAETKLDEEKCNILSKSRELSNKGIRRRFFARVRERKSGKCEERVCGTNEQFGVYEGSLF
jgi:hypothetical protein